MPLPSYNERPITMNERMNENIYDCHICDFYARLWLGWLYAWWARGLLLPGTGLSCRIVFLSSTYIFLILFAPAAFAQFHLRVYTNIVAHWPEPFVWANPLR